MPCLAVAGSPRGRQRDPVPLAVALGPGWSTGYQGGPCRRTHGLQGSGVNTHHLSCCSGHMLHPTLLLCAYRSFHMEGVQGSASESNQVASAHQAGYAELTRTSGQMYLIHGKDPEKHRSIHTKLHILGSNICNRFLLAQQQLSWYLTNSPPAKSLSGDLFPPLEILRSRLFV